MDLSKKASEFKKIQRFNTKIKQNDVKNRDVILKEMETLNLSKLISIMLNLCLIIILDISVKYP